MSTKTYRYNSSIFLTVGETVGNYLIIAEVFNEKIKGYEYLVRCKICGKEKIAQRANLRNQSGKFGCRSCYLSQCKKNKNAEYGVSCSYGNLELSNKNSVVCANKKEVE